MAIALTVSISAVAFALSFWIELLIAGLFLKNLNSRYIAVLLLSLTPALLSLGKAPGKSLTFLLVGLPILGLMYWRASQAALKPRP